jgi:hypothetical protein
MPPIRARARRRQHMTWLSNYLQTARGLSLVGSGIFTSIPCFAASVVNVVANWSGDRYPRKAELPVLYQSTIRRVLSRDRAEYLARGPPQALQSLPT